MGTGRACGSPCPPTRTLVISNVLESMRLPRLILAPRQLMHLRQQGVRLVDQRLRLLLVDGPVDKLDRRGRLEVMAFLQALQQRGLTIVLATREAELALYATRQIALRDGSIEHDAPVPTRRIAIKELASNGYTGSGNGDISQRETLSIKIQEELL